MVPQPTGIDHLRYGLMEFPNRWSRNLKLLRKNLNLKPFIQPLKIAPFDPNLAQQMELICIYLHATSHGSSIDFRVMAENVFHIKISISQNVQNIPLYKGYPLILYFYKRVMLAVQMAFASCCSESMTFLPICLVQINIFLKFDSMN